MAETDSSLATTPTQSIVDVAHQLDGREVARRLIFDEKYLKSVQDRMVLGLAGPLELYLWKMALGDWKKYHHTAEQDEEKFRRLREAMKNLRKDHPEKANELDLLVQASGATVDVDVEPPEPENGDPK